MNGRVEQGSDKGVENKVWGDGKNGDGQLNTGKGADSAEPEDAES